MKVILLLLFATFSLNATAFTENEFSKINAVPADLYSVAISPFNEELVFVGSDSSVFKSKDRGLSFKKILAVQADSKKVNKVYCSPHHYQNVFFATDAGLYATNNLGSTFHKIFKEQDDEGNYIKCLSLIKVGTTIYVGTNKGLYAGKQNIYNFKRLVSIPRDALVFDIKVSFADGAIVLATSKGVYLSQHDKPDFKRVFIAGTLSSSEEQSEGQEDESGYRAGRGMPQCLLVDKEKPSVMYLGTSSGLFESSDSAKTWHKLSIPGLDSLNIRSLAKDMLSEKVLYLAGDRGLYRLQSENKSLHNIHAGLVTQDIRDIALQKDTGRVLLATASGLYKSRDSKSTPLVLTTDDTSFLAEPTYLEVQEQVLRYNNIHPDKTKRWHTALKFRALMPSVALDYDKTVNYDSGADSYYTGPYDWGVRVSWDLADVVWNSYEDDVDTRARLNTQTRLDILDEVRRLYFERKKIKSELLRNPPQDRIELLKKELYLEELSAALDGYTGGYFSKRIKQLQTYNPQ
ncbi:hypothetical protein ACFL2W_00095 [Candidatus Omnitrophota bacterium]